MQNVDVTSLEKRFEGIRNKYPQINNALNSPLPAGTQVFNKGDLLVTMGERNVIHDVLNRRHSIRFYKKSDLSTELIEKILLMAQTAPSTCNRQTVNVWYSLDFKKISRLMSVYQEMVFLK